MKYDIEVDNARLIQQIFRLSNTLLATLIRDEKLSPAQAHILLFLHKKKTLNPSQLAKHLFISSASVTQTLAPMERSGLITRQRDPSDRRKVFLELTPSGRQIADKIHAIHQGLFCASFKGFSLEESKDLKSYLMRLSQNIYDNIDKTITNKEGRNG